MVASKITALEHVRAMRAAGWPLNTEVHEGGQLPKRCQDAIKQTLRAATHCRAAAYRYVTKQTSSNFTVLKRALRKLGREIGNIPPPNWIDEPDGKRLLNPEDSVVYSIVAPRCFTAFQHWTEIIAELEAGNEVQFTIHTPNDVWPVETEGPQSSQR